MLAVYKFCFAAIFDAEIFYSIPICLAGVIDAVTVFSDKKS